MCKTTKMQMAFWLFFYNRQKPSGKLIYLYTSSKERICMKVLATKNAAVSTTSFNWKAYIKRYWQLYALLFLPMLYLLIFKYIPMKYVLIAFKKSSIVQKVGEMPWADNHGFQYFIQAFHNKDFLNALRNTVCLNLLDLCIGFPIPIIFALINFS